ncbi:hypothetical protein BC830DRAFT_348320 [Chytriomyces sp. MP71]|nr:hypothetical protein BC830DRAFT_348320 [Chytriomyces sp. MP71]
MLKLKYHSKRFLFFAIILVSMGITVLFMGMLEGARGEMPAAISKEINVALLYMTLKDVAKDVQALMHEGQLEASNCKHPMYDTPLKCTVRIPEELNTTEPDGFYIHVPNEHWTQIFEKRYPNIVHSTTRFQNVSIPAAKIGVTRESPRYYPEIDDPVYMSRYDLTFSYRLDSSVVLPFTPFDVRTTNSVPPFSARKPRIVFFNSNCDAPIQRTAFVQALMDAGLPIDSYGKCLNNIQPPPGNGNFDFELKVRLFQEYRICVVIENSVARDYVTEKVWDGLKAGCVPIYTGAPNFRQDFEPSNNSVILVDDYFRLENGRIPPHNSLDTGFSFLIGTIMKVLESEEEFETYQTWRRVPFEQLNKGYQNVVMTSSENAYCRLCKSLAERKERIYRQYWRARGYTISEKRWTKDLLEAVSDNE